MIPDFKLRVITWNVGGSSPPEDLTSLLGLGEKELPDLYAIGLQELKSDTTTLITDSIFDDPWSNAITLTLSQRGYVRVKSLRMVGIHLSIYIKRSQLMDICKVESEFTRTGLGGIWGNKGGVTIRLTCHGVNMCFVNSHFTAHSNNFGQRIEDYTQVLLTQRFRDNECPNILDQDYVFWMGDLNFRLPPYSFTNEEVRRKVQEGKHEELLKEDELNTARKQKLVFPSFEEGAISFPPTFKFDVGTDQYDTSVKNRTPAWCDRILWRVHKDAFPDVELSVKQHEYTSLSQYKNSDHKPVVSSFTIKVMAPVTWSNHVVFEPLKSWSRGKDQSFFYSVHKLFPTSNRDWIGLFPVNFKTFEEYSTYIRAGSNGEDNNDGSFLYRMSFEERDLDKVPSGKYRLYYFSDVYNFVIGHSDEIELLDYDQASSSEDDRIINELHVEHPLPPGLARVNPVQRSRPLNAEHPILDEPRNPAPEASKASENIPEPIEKVPEEEVVPEGDKAPEVEEALVVREVFGGENKNEVEKLPEETEKLPEQEKEIEIKELRKVVKVSELVKKIEENANGSAVEDVRVDGDAGSKPDDDDQDAHELSHEILIPHLQSVQQVESKSEMPHKIEDDSKDQLEEPSSEKMTSEMEPSNLESEEHQDVEVASKQHQDVKATESSFVEEETKVDSEVHKVEDASDSKVSTCNVETEVAEAIPEVTKAASVESFDDKVEILEKVGETALITRPPVNENDDKQDLTLASDDKIPAEEIQSINKIQTEVLVEECKKEVSEVLLEPPVEGKTEDTQEVTKPGNVGEVIDQVVDKSDDQHKERGDEVVDRVGGDRKSEAIDETFSDQSVVVEDVVKVEKLDVESAIKPEEVVLTPDSDDSKKEETSESITQSSSSDFEIIQPPSKHSTLESFEDSYLSMREDALADKEGVDKENVEKVTVTSAFATSEVEDPELIESINAQLLDQNVKGFSDSFADFEDVVESVKLEHETKSSIDDGEKKDDKECVVVEEALVFDDSTNKSEQQPPVSHDNQLETSEQPEDKNVEEFVDKLVATAVQEAVVGYAVEPQQQQNNNNAAIEPQQQQNNNNAAIEPQQQQNNNNAAIEPQQQQDNAAVEPQQQDDVAKPHDEQSETKQNETTLLVQTVKDELIQQKPNVEQHVDEDKVDEAVEQGSVKDTKLPIMEEFSTLEPIPQPEVEDVKQEDHKQPLSSDQPVQSHLEEIETLHQDVSIPQISDLKSEEICHETHSETVELPKKYEVKTLAEISEPATHFQHETADKFDKDNVEEPQQQVIVAQPQQDNVAQPQQQDIEVTPETKTPETTTLVSSQLENLASSDHMTSEDNPSTEHFQPEVIKHVVKDEIQEKLSSEVPVHPQATSQSGDSNFFNAYMDLREKSLVETEERKKDGKKEEEEEKASNVVAKETVKSVDMDLIDKNLNDFGEEIGLHEEEKKKEEPQEVDGEYQARKEAELLIKDDLKTETHATGDSQHHEHLSGETKPETEEKESIVPEDLVTGAETSIDRSSEKESHSTGTTVFQASSEEPSRDKLELFNKKVEVKEEILESTNQ